MAYRTIAEALVRGHGVERPIYCPVHDDANPSASVNVRKGLWHCYSCGAGGKVTDAPEPSDDDFAREVLGALDEAAPSAYPETWLTQFLVADPTYWLSRFTPAAVSHFQLGYDTIRHEPCYPLRGEAGELLGVVYRTDGKPKYRYPKGVKTHQLLAGYSSQPFAPHAYLLEGYADMVACWEATYPTTDSAAYGLYGAQLSENQIRLLHRAGVRRVTLVLDNDAPGRLASHKIAQALLAEGFVVDQVGAWPDGVKDLGDTHDLDLRRTILSNLIAI